MHCPRHDWSSPSTPGLLSHGMLAVCYIKAPHLCRDSTSHPFPVFQARATSHFLHLLRRQCVGRFSLLRALQVTITPELLLSLDVETNSSFASNIYSTPPPSTPVRWITMNENEFNRATIRSMSDKQLTLDTECELLGRYLEKQDDERGAFEMDSFCLLKAFPCGHGAEQEPSLKILLSFECL